jgi:hypothetical protein
MNGEELYLLETIKSLRGLKSLGEKAIEQISDEQLHYSPDPESNSVAIIMKHIAGNMLSRFTDFMTSDGEKAWRNRDKEFIDEKLNRSEILILWNKGWECTLKAVNDLKPADLTKKVFIREEEHTVMRALQRQLVHYAYHTGQIVYLCKQIQKSGFHSLSIPRGQSDNYVPQTPK